MYRHSCKCLNIELLKTACYLAIAFIFFDRQFESKLSLFSVIENAGVLVISYLLLPHQLAFQMIQLVLIGS